MTFFKQTRDLFVINSNFFEWVVFSGELFVGNVFVNTGYKMAISFYNPMLNYFL